MLEYLKLALNYQEIIWALKMIGIIFLTLLLSYTAGRFIDYFEKKLINNKTIWDDLLLRSAKQPLRLLIWIMGALLAIKTTSYHININLIDFTTLAKNLGVIFCLAWFVWKIINEYETHLTINREANAVDLTTIVAITKLCKSIILIVASLMVLQSFGISIAGVLAFGGIGGIAIGFASRDLLANFFGAMMIFLDRPFLVGDHIRSPDRQIEGTVQYVSWRLTHIKTPDTRILYVPNSLFSTIIIENLSRIANRRINEIIKIRSQDLNKIEKIIAEIRNLLAHHPAIDQKQKSLVTLSALGEYFAELTIDSFTYVIELPKYHAVKQEILLQISDIITRNDAAIAIPTSLVNINNHS